MSLQLLLAVACVLEVDLGPTDQQERWDRECRLMWAVSFETARRSGVPLAQVVRRYDSGLRCAGKPCDTPRMRRLRGLREDGAEPAGWDARHDGPWDRYRARWLRRLAVAAQFVQDARAGSWWPQDARSGCRAATQFGGRCALTGACDPVPSCWRLAPCGQTQQSYWIVRRCESSARVLTAVEAAGR